MNDVFYVRLSFTIMVIVVAALIGGVLYWRGRWGKRIGTEPRCRKCGYNLTGLTSDRCPECGTVLTAKSTVHGLRPRRPVSRVLGIVLLLPLLIWLGLIAAPWAKQSITNAYYASRSVDSLVKLADTHPRATRELWERWNGESPTTDAEERSRILEEIFKQFSFRTQYWDIQGYALLQRGKAAEAEQVARACLESRQANLPIGHWLTGSAKFLLGESLAGQEKFEEAELLLLNGYATMKGDAEAPRLRVHEFRLRIVKFYEAWGKPEKADPYRVAASAVPQSSARYAPDPIPSNQMPRIPAPEGLGSQTAAPAGEAGTEPSNAKPMPQRDMDPVSMMAYYRNPANAAAQFDKGIKLLGQGRVAEAEKVFRTVFRTRQAGLPIGHWRTGYAMNLIGLSLARQEKFEEAEPFLLNGYATMKGDPKANPLRVDEARLRIVWFYEAWGKPEKAEAFRVTQADSAQVPGEPTP